METGKKSISISGKAIFIGVLCIIAYAYYGAVGVVVAAALLLLLDR